MRGYITKQLMAIHRDLTQFEQQERGILNHIPPPFFLVLRLTQIPVGLLPKYCKSP